MKETAKHKEAFFAWYELNRHFDETASKLRVSNNTLSSWIKVFNWHERADKLDEKAFQRLSEKVADEKAKRTKEMIEAHFQQGDALIIVGSKYLTEKGVDNGAQAIAALRAGVEIQRTAEGLATGKQEIAGELHHKHSIDAKTIEDINAAYDGTGE